MVCLGILEVMGILDLKV